MNREDICNVLKKMNPHDMTKVVLTMRYNAAITIDAIARFEEDYIVLRGREAGTNDEGRAFFVPFEDILYLKLDRVVSINEMKRLYGEKIEDEKNVLATKEEAAAAEAKSNETKASPIPVPAPAMDPAGIAKQNLLNRIRAARSGVSPNS